MSQRHVWVLVVLLLLCASVLSHVTSIHQVSSSLEELVTQRIDDFIHVDEKSTQLIELSNTTDNDISDSTIKATHDVREQNQADDEIIQDSEMFKKLTTEMPNLSSEAQVDFLLLDQLSSQNLEQEVFQTMSSFNVTVSVHKSNADGTTPSVEQFVTGDHMNSSTTANILTSASGWTIAMIIGVTAAGSAVFILLCACLCVMCRRRHVRKKRALVKSNHGHYTGLFDETITLSYITELYNQLDLSKDIGEEMSSLESDTYLRSLECSIIVNQWTGSSRNTRI